MKNLQTCLGLMISRNASQKWRILLSSVFRAGHRTVQGSKRVSQQQTTSPEECKPHRLSENVSSRRFVFCSATMASNVSQSYA